ncbi:MAG: hypothetical protein AAF663_06820, partial [Planctomycetota bacterium]
MAIDLTQATMIGLRDAVASKQVSAVELTQAYLDRRHLLRRHRVAQADHRRLGEVDRHVQAPPPSPSTLGTL